METISPSLLTFLLNSLWQIPLAAAVAALVSWSMRNAPSSHRHAVWVAALAMAVLLPAASVRTQARRAGTLSFAPPSAATSMPALDSAARAQRPDAQPASPLPQSVSLPASAAGLLLAAYALFAIFRLARLAWAAARTAQIRRTARAAPISDSIARVGSRCAQAFGLQPVEIRFSPRISGPVAAGRTIILPDCLLSETSKDVLTTAIGHEMAHIARRDFSWNLCYELLLIPIGFQPAAWWIRSRIARTREMACDELVTERLMDRHTYAASIVSIASAMTALPRPGYTLGVFDGDVLEERIRRLVERPAANLKRAPMLLAAGLCALALSAVLASGLAVTAHAQDDPYGYIAQAAAAFAQGDLDTAIAQVENAVRAEPGNVKARMLLVNALLRKAEPPLTETNPWIARAREQLAAILATQPANVEAPKGMAYLCIDTRQFAEARDWALKAIAAGHKDANTYYMLGFIDWMIAYPDYMEARQSAGMGAADPGIIPDAALRESVRKQHGAQLDEGFRVLQLALQIDPDYADAMAYMNLLYRIEAGIADTPAAFTALTTKADDWMQKALETKRKHPAQSPRPTTSSPLDTFLTSPPPPPPPPPPPAHAQTPRVVVSGHLAFLTTAAVLPRLGVLMMQRDGAARLFDVASPSPLMRLQPRPKPAH
jgi:beta-lactamase regulating signal transducer with metallopeptidase domain